MSRKHTYNRLSGPMELIAALTFRENIGMGLAPEYWYEDRVGVTPEILIADCPLEIWDASDEYQWPTGPTIAQVYSLDGTDVGIPIEVSGLDGNGVYKSQEITLNGMTPVALPTPLWRVFRMEVKGSTPIVGIVKLTNLGDTVNYAFLRPKNQVTFLGTFTVPVGIVAFLYEGEFGFRNFIKDSYAKCAYYSRRRGEVWKCKKKVGITASGGSNYTDTRVFPDVIPALTDVKLVVEEISTDGLSIFGTYDIMFVAQEKLDPSFLQRIGQPMEM